MQRVSVVGISGSGKSTLAQQLAAALAVPCIELDSIFHQSGWQPLDTEEFVRRLDAATSGPAWVVDGNYASVVREGPVWQRADTVVWLDLPRSTVMRQIVWRTLRRLGRREVLWNGNRERFRNLVAWDPEESVIRWAWTHHHASKARYTAAMNDPAYAHMRFICITSRAAADALVAAVRVPN